MTRIWNGKGQIHVFLVAHGVATVIRDRCDGCGADDDLLDMVEWVSTGYLCQLVLFIIARGDKSRAKRASSGN